MIAVLIFAALTIFAGIVLACCCASGRADDLAERAFEVHTDQALAVAADDWQMWEVGR